MVGGFAVAAKRKSLHNCAMVWLNWLCGLFLEEVSGTQQVTLVHTMHFHAEGCVHVWTRGP